MNAPELMIGLALLALSAALLIPAILRQNPAIMVAGGSVYIAGCLYILFQAQSLMIPALLLAFAIGTFAVLHMSAEHGSNMDVIAS